MMLSDQAQAILSDMFIRYRDKYLDHHPRASEHDAEVSFLYATSQSVVYDEDYLTFRSRIAGLGS